MCQPPAHRCLGEGSAVLSLTTKSDGWLRAAVWKKAPPQAVVIVCSKPEAGQNLIEPAEATKVH